MATQAAYLTVVIIWSITPLMVVWSNDSISPALAAAARMVAALVLGLVYMALRKQALPMTARAWQAYSAAALGTFGAMALTYTAAQYVPSGLISIMFGLTPIATMAMAFYLLRERLPSLGAIIGVVIALAGMVLLFYQSLLDEAQNRVLGMLLLLGAVALFSLSGVLVKKLSVQMQPLALTMGSLLIAVPLFSLLVVLSGTYISPLQWSARSLLGVIFLATGGSLVGWLAYYYVLERISVTAVSMVTLITPMIAVWLGVVLNGEHLNFVQSLASITILLGLALFTFAGMGREKVKALKV